jgi:hypothetical protein
LHHTLWEEYRLGKEEKTVLRRMIESEKKKVTDGEK